MSFKIDEMLGNMVSWAHFLEISNPYKGRAVKAVFNYLLVWIDVAGHTSICPTRVHFMTGRHVLEMKVNKCPGSLELEHSPTYVLYKRYHHVEATSWV